MNNLLTAILCLIAGTVAAQQAPCIGWAKEGLEANYLNDYEVVTKDYRKGNIISPTEFCHYWNPNASFKDKSLVLEFNKNDICVKALNSGFYDDLKQMVQYMDDHFIRLDSTHWKTVDNLFLFTVNSLPGRNMFEVETVAAPKPIVKKPTPRRK